VEASGERTTFATVGAGAVTVIAAELLTPDVVAEIVVLPGATALTRPDELTVAMLLLLEDQVKVTPPIA
jgi:hypothetical protein